MEREKYLKTLGKINISKPIKKIKIGNREVGSGQPALIIAEVGANHRGDIQNAYKAIELAAKAGADVVKFQHLTHDKIAAPVPVSYSWKGKSDFKTLSEFYKPSSMPYEWTAKLIKHAKKNKIMFLSTPFDTEAVDVLEKNNVQAYKVASYELTDDVLLRYIAKTGKPIIISTGMAYLEEVAHAVNVVQQVGNHKIILLHCVSMYPPRSYGDMNLKAIQTLSDAFQIPVGFSDHSSPDSIAATLGAAALGACVIERHFTDTQEGGSRDDSNSVEPVTFNNLVKEIRNLENAMSAPGIKQPVSYDDHKWDEIYDRWARRSIYLKNDMKKGQTIKEKDLITLRPWGGIEPKYFDLVKNRKLVRDIKAYSPLTWDDLLG